MFAVLANFTYPAEATATMSIHYQFGGWRSLLRAEWKARCIRKSRPATKSKPVEKEEGSMTPTTTNNAITPKALTLPARTGGAELTPEELAGVSGATLLETPVVVYLVGILDGLRRDGINVSACVK